MIHSGRSGRATAAPAAAANPTSAAPFQIGDLIVVRAGQRERHDLAAGMAFGLRHGVADGGGLGGGDAGRESGGACDRSLSGDSSAGRRHSRAELVDRDRRTSLDLCARNPASPPMSSSTPPRLAARPRRRCRPRQRGSAANAQELVFLAFGDSITDGYGDTSNPGGGYPPRLQRWLRQQGYDAVVESHGVGGETTSAGLSRIDSVLAGGGDYLLLMEGTNDISRRVGVESIRFNLDEMASRAEALGMIAVHASVIPRIPTAPVDSDNSATSALAHAIRDMGADTHRAVVDQFTLFESLPDLFDNYYYYDPDSRRSRRVTRTPTATSRSRVSSSRPSCRCSRLRRSRSCPPPARFRLAPSPPSRRWQRRRAVRAGRVGLRRRRLRERLPRPATSPPSTCTFTPERTPLPCAASTAGGAVSEDSVQVVVSGTEPAWETASTLIPLIVESADGQVVSDLDAGELRQRLRGHRSGLRARDRLRRAGSGPTLRRASPEPDEDRRGSRHRLRNRCRKRARCGSPSTPSPAPRRRNSPRAPSCTLRAIPTAATAPSSPEFPRPPGPLPASRSPAFRTTRRPSRRSWSRISTASRGTVSFDLDDAPRRRNRFRRPRARSRTPPACGRSTISFAVSPRARRHSGRSSPRAAIRFSAAALVHHPASGEVRVLTATP